MNKHPNPTEIDTFQNKVLSWYAKHQRDLPWRKNRDPYRILVSEVMLQQTQVSRVIAKYNTWFEAFPTLKSLANAPTGEVLRLWSGLGYNRRALFLQKTAKTIVFDHAGKWPQTVEALKKLPGIGEYTAAAIACFAFNQQVAVVDTNVRKILIVEFHASNDELARQLLPPRKAYDWNQALMDYASVVLKKEKIPLPKQTRFPGSRRYFRGKLLKLLVEKQIMKVSELSLQVNDAGFSIDKATLANILEGLERDGFIKITGEKIALVE